MAMISITYQCGHTDRRRVSAHSSDYWQQRGKNELCRDCWLDQQNAQAAEAAHTQGLIALTGTPRQIEWAETLRQTILKEVAELEAKIPTPDPQRQTWDRLVRKLFIQSQAGWWIDQRGRGVLSLFRRWEQERQEADRVKPVAELLGQVPAPQTTPAASPPARVGFTHPTPVLTPTPLREAAQDDHPPVAGYRSDGHRRIEIDAQEETS